VKDVLLSGALDVKQLQLKEGQAWKLFLDIYVLDADGGIFDICLLAAVSALLALKLPSAEIDEDGKVSRTARYDLSQVKIMQCLAAVDRAICASCKTWRCLSPLDIGSVQHSCAL